MLVHSPTFLFMLPGALAAIGGVCALIVLAAIPGLGEPWTAAAVAFAIFAIVGVGALQLGLFSRTYAVVYLGETDARLEQGWRRLRLEHGLAASAAIAAIGLAIALVAFFDRANEARLGILGLTLVAIGLQSVFGCFFLSILGLSEHAILRRRSPTSDSR
jgi:hypothetical protein